TRSSRSTSATQPASTLRARARSSCTSVIVANAPSAVPFQTTGVGESSCAARANGSAAQVADAPSTDRKRRREAGNAFIFHPGLLRSSSFARAYPAASSMTRGLLPACRCADGTEHVIVGDLVEPRQPPAVLRTEVLCHVLCRE